MRALLELDAVRRARTLDDAHAHEVVILDERLGTADARALDGVALVALEPRCNVTCYC